MVLFREHRSLLEDSMKTVVEVNSRDELKQHLYKVTFQYKNKFLLSINYNN